jgi:hypothetical protein
MQELQGCVPSVPRRDTHGTKGQGVGMICPDCGSEMRLRGDGHFPDCEMCGFVQLSAYSIQLRDETRREFEQAELESWPEPVPSYREWMER